MVSSRFLQFKVHKAFLWASALICLVPLVQMPCFAQESQLPPMSQQNQNVENGNGQQASSQYYYDYMQKAMDFYNKSDYGQAIDLMKKALQLSPNNPSVINNLAASLIQQGVYYQNTKKDYKKAVDDYRQGLFYMVYDWPDGVLMSPQVSQNVKILRLNIDNAMKSLREPTEDWKWHLKTAWDLRRKGQLEEAMVEYGWVTQLNPRDSEAWLAQGDIYRVKQNPGKAASAYQKAIDTASSPTDDLYVKLGTALLQNGDPEKAVTMYNKALSINPKNQDALLALEQVWNKEIVLNPRNMSAHLNLGAVYQQLGNYDDAFAQYQVADRLTPNNPLVKLDLGSLYQAKGQLNQALSMYNAVLQQDPNNTQAMLYKADILEQQGNHQEAAQLLQNALQGSSDKKQVLNQLMAIYKTEGDPQKIKMGWERYANTFPQDASIQYQAGLALHEIKDYADAVTYYQRAADLNPQMSDAYANMGAALHAMHQDKEALTALKRALSLDPTLQQVKSLIAAIGQQSGSEALVKAAQLHEQGKYQEALKYYEQALKEDPNNADIEARYGLALQALNKDKEASAAYDQAIALAPDNGTYYYYKGTLFDSQNQDDTAKKLYEKALALDPSLTQAKQALSALASTATDSQLDDALAAYNKKQYETALNTIDTVLKTDPNNATAYYYKGLVYDAQKKLEPARSAYAKAIALNPQNSDAVYALAVVLDTQGEKLEAKKAYQQFLGLKKNQPEDTYMKYAKQRVSSLK